ncbi:MAG TPA: cellulose biosynthesis protein BcsS [Gammaproteobacteria bacterium]|nr:cellulose biosynthesis protein BcsS [Gammaproteobacteria bacterium]
MPRLAGAEPGAEALGLVSDASDRQDLVVISFRELPRDRQVRLWRDTATRRALLAGHLAEVPEYRDTRLRPDDPANDARGGRALLLAQGQWRRRLSGRWSLRVIANDALGPGGYWGRLRAARRLPGGVTVGPSLVRQGGPGYRAWQGGVFARWPVARRWHVELAGGYQKYAGLVGEGYAGFSPDLAC